ncbi:hypothetical protein Dimus_035374 [Dionaea muscipula]
MQKQSRHGKNAGLELIKLKEVYAGLGFSTLDISGIFDGDTQENVQKNVQKALTILQSLMGKNPLDCLREEYIVLPVYGEEVSSTKWYMEYLKPLVSKLDTPTNLRQHLALVPLILLICMDIQYYLVGDLILPMTSSRQIGKPLHS